MHKKFLKKLITTLSNLNNHNHNKKIKKIFIKENLSPSSENQANPNAQNSQQPTTTKNKVDQILSYQIREPYAILSPKHYRIYTNNTQNEALEGEGIVHVSEIKNSSLFKKIYEPNRRTIILNSRGEHLVIQNGSFFITTLDRQSPTFPLTTERIPYFIRLFFNENHPSTFE
ncbi:MAG: hypothetical protein N3A54_03290 [Patescibacteria group bacterium]|nr:hypothetical protein [Patescibacteria group bacterium]